MAAPAIEGVASSVVTHAANNKLRLLIVFLLPGSPCGPSLYNLACGSLKARNERRKRLVALPVPECPEELLTGLG